MGKLTWAFAAVRGRPELVALAVAGKQPPAASSLETSFYPTKALIEKLTIGKFLNRPLYRFR
jgi:hypothetical protein